MSEQEQHEAWLARYTSALPELAKDVQAYEKSTSEIASIRCCYETVERQPNYLAAIHGNEEEARFIASNKVEYQHTGRVFVTVTFADESILCRTYFNSVIATK